MLTHHHQQLRKHGLAGNLPPFVVEDNHCGLAEVFYWLHVLPVTQSASSVHRRKLKALTLTSEDLIIPSSNARLARKGALFPSNANTQTICDTNRPQVVKEF